MKRTKLFAILLTLALAVAMLAGCSNTPAPEPAPEPEAPVVESTPEPEAPSIEGDIMIAAAASLQNAFEGDLIPLFKEQQPGITVTGTYDSSGKLQTQIEEGLDAQIFFSAANKQMTALVDGGFIDAAKVVKLLENEVVLITGTNTDTSVTSFENITDASTIAIGDPGSVPAGQYAQEVLTSLGLWDAVEAGAPSYGTNVTEVLNWVAEGSAEVGIVYATDAASMSDKVKIIAVAAPDTMESAVIYPVGLQTDIVADKSEAATAFFEFLQSPEALAIFAQYGFKAA